MRNVTLAVDDQLVARSRRYAKEHHTSLNHLIRDLLSQTVQEENGPWLDECFRKMDAAGGHSAGRTWQREDLYDV